jgi:hypothetical protein
VLNQTLLIQDGFVDACYYPIELESIAFSNDAFALAAGNLEIIHRDESGREWRSTAGVQPVTSIAEVVSMEYYGDSPAGHKAYTITLRLSVELTDPETNETRIFESEDLVLPFGHF